MTNAAWWDRVRAEREAEGRSSLPTDTLWALTTANHTITATIAPVPAYGRELRFTRDGELWRSKMFRDGELAELFDAAGLMRTELEARGWTQ